ncbi:MAG: YesL family protein [Blautia sp.]|jgi:uncharacterized membrane protein YesL
MKIDFSGKFYTVGTRITDIVLLNLIYLVFCLPVVTIGAATTALYYVALKMAENKDSYIFRSFFKSFKENFRQSTIIWLILLVIGLFISIDFRIILAQDGSFFKIFLYLLSMTTVLLLFVLLYVFPVLSKFYNSIKATFKNAFLMSLRHLPYTLAIFFISALPFLVFLTNMMILLRLLPLLLLCGFSLPAYLNSLLFKRIFVHYIPEEESTPDAPL